MHPQRWLSTATESVDLVRDGAGLAARRQKLGDRRVAAATSNYTDPSRCHHSDNPQGCATGSLGQRSHPFPRTPLLRQQLLRKNAPGQRAATGHSAVAVLSRKSQPRDRRGAGRGKRRRDLCCRRRSRRYGHELRAPSGNRGALRRTHRGERRLLPADHVSP